MLTKTTLKEQIEKFPEKFSIEELIERLIVIEKIERGNEQSENGEIVPESELNAEIAKWFE
jgi:predicted transcriptional regulator